MSQPPGGQGYCPIYAARNFITNRPESLEQFVWFEDDNLANSLMETSVQSDRSQVAISLFVSEKPQVVIPYIFYVF
jgi:hypothetical protein